MIKLHDDEIVLDLSIEFENSLFFHINRKEDNKHIGNCGLRLDKNKNNYILGNIEYEVFNEYQGNNYAYKACLLLGKVASMKGATSLILTANPDNIASIKTIEKLDVKHLEVKKVPKSHYLYKKGDRYVTIYEWNIEGERKNDRHKINKRK